METIKQVVYAARALTDYQINKAELTRYNNISISVKDMKAIQRALAATQMVLDHTHKTIGGMSCPKLETLLQCQVGKQVCRICATASDSKTIPVTFDVSVETIVEVDIYDGIKTTSDGSKIRNYSTWDDIWKTVYFDSGRAEWVVGELKKLVRRLKVGEDLYIISSNNAEICGPYPIVEVGKDGVVTEGPKTNWAWSVIVKRVFDFYPGDLEAAKRELENRQSEKL